MTIERAYSSGWGVGEKLTSAQLNQIDSNTAAALDKRAGKGDLLASVVQATGSGRIISTVQTGPDASTTFHIQGGNSIVRIPTLTAARAYTLGHTGATGGDRMLFYIEGTGATPSGYVDVKNNVGTGLFRLGAACVPSPNLTAAGARAEFIFGPTGWVSLGAESQGMRRVEVASTSSWVCPPGIHSVLLMGYGAGGGGGCGGMPHVSSTYASVNGGGGGGGAIESSLVVPVEPFSTYSIEIGAGGIGGASGAAGGGGGATRFVSPAGVALASFAGGGGGVAGASITDGFNSAAIYAHGGRPTAHSSTPTAQVVYSGLASWLLVDCLPAYARGGGSVAGEATTIVQQLINAGFGYGGGNKGYTGGPPGIATLASVGVGGGARYSGGGGGGGAAGPGGIGATGGYGGYSVPTTGFLPTFGATGMYAADNSGAGGGGGGGGGGSLNQGAGAGGRGGAGGSGKLSIIFYV